MKNVILIISVFFISCTKSEDKKDYETENVYEVISYLINYKSKDFLPSVAFPPLPDNKGMPVYTTKDSLSSYRYFYEQFKRNKVIAIEKSLKPFKEKYLFDDCKYFKSDEYNKFTSTDKISSLDLEKIFVKENDSLIFYNETFKELEGRGFGNKFDIFFEFSKISFNKSYNKAVIYLGVSFGKLNGFSTLIYLEKKHFHWEIKCEETLSIS